MPTFARVQCWRSAEPIGYIRDKDKEIAVSRISRRRFLAAASATAAAGASACRTVAASEGGVYRVIDEAPFGGQTRRLKLTRGGRYVTALIFPTDYPTHFRLKPELFPVCTPRGIPVTGCMRTFPGSVLKATVQRGELCRRLER
jgi:hypothetical protein